MKNMIKSFAFLFVLTLGLTFNLSAQDDASGLAGVENTVATGDAGVLEAAKDGNLKTEAAKDKEEKKADLSFSQKLKQKFNKSIIRIYYFSCLLVMLF